MYIAFLPYSAFSKCLPTDKDRGLRKCLMKKVLSDFCRILYAAVITLFTLWQHHFSITLVLKLELNFKADTAYCIL